MAHTRRDVLASAAGLLAQTALAACARRAAGSARFVAVAAASDLRPVMEPVREAFRAGNPALDLRVTFGASGNLFAQITNGAPFDVFLSADVGYPRQLEARGLVAQRSGSLFVYGTGRVALFVRNDAGITGLDARGLSVLTEAPIRRVAMANPRHAPYGRAAEAALRTAGLYDAVQPKLVLAENVAQAAQFVQQGAAEAALVSLSLALSPALRALGRHVLPPLESYPRMDQGGCVLRRANPADDAWTFREAMLSPRTAALLRAHGIDHPQG